MHINKVEAEILAKVLEENPDTLPLAYARNKLEASQIALKGVELKDRLLAYAEDGRQTWNSSLRNGTKTKVRKWAGLPD